MLRLLSAFAFLLLASSAGPAGDKDKENPFKNAKVGDYISYKISHKIMGLASQGTMKQTVTAKDDKTVTLKAVTSVLGKDSPAEMTTIDLSKPFDPTLGVLRDRKGEDKFKKTGEGKEKLKVNGKEYECTWIAGTSSSEFAGLKVELEVKAWFSKAVPFNGLVKMESKGNMVNTTIHLTKFGNAKEKEKEKEKEKTP